MFSFCFRAPAIPQREKFRFWPWSLSPIQFSAAEGKCSAAALFCEKIRILHYAKEWQSNFLIFFSCDIPISFLPEKMKYDKEIVDVPKYFSSDARDL